MKNLQLKNLIRETFEELIREIVRQEQRPSYYIDESGHKVFFNEYAYSRFVESHPDKLPSELNASFIDAQGFRCHYSDYELKPAVASRLHRSRCGKEIGMSLLARGFSDGEQRKTTLGNSACEEEVNLSK
jgi:hypothetical protein